jgi:D-alanyl-D-alanine dipeptidase
MKKISPDHLVPMDIFLDDEPITLDVVYAQADHPRNIFCEALYHSNARLWAQYDMARIILLVARKLHKITGGKLELKDCLRTYEAQDAMQHTQVVKDHPEWMVGENRLLSPSGHGAHPRGMAIDVCVLNKQGHEIDMGTEFDEMTEQSARDYKGFSDEILNNRLMLENAFIESARELELEILPLPSEWWDFRFPSNVYGDYAPLHDTDLPKQMRMVSTNGPDIPDFPDPHFETLKNNILASLN